MRTINKIITKANCKYGAPMGRSNVFPKKYHFVEGNYLVNSRSKRRKKIYDCFVPMNGAYDTGGAYWGLGSRLRVSYTKDLSYVNFYRM